MSHWKTTFAAVATALALAACPASHAHADDVTVGIMMPLTGSFAAAGVPIAWAMELAVEHANKQSFLGDTKVRSVVVDDASDKGQAITLVSRLAQSDKALMIFGPDTSIEAVSAAPKANELRIPMMAIGSSRAILAAGPYSFKVQVVGADIMYRLSDYATQKLGIKRIALVFDQSNEGVVQQKDAFKSSLLAAGVKIVSEDAILSTDTDFLALSTKLASLDVDAIFVGAGPAEVGGNVLLQAKQAGVSDRVAFLSPSTFATDTFIASATGAAEGAYVLADYNIANPSELNRQFVADFTKRHGVRPDNWAAMGYTIARLGLQAIKNASPNPTRDKVKEALTALRDQEVIVGNGVWTQDAARNPSYGAVILRVRDGKFVLAPNQ